MHLPPASEEQLAIVHSLKDNNIIVDSIAGCGKTTTNLHIASTYTDEKILLLTYNKKLQLETREKVSALALKNIEVHTYHSFVCKYYDRKCFTDFEMIRIFSSRNGVHPLKKFHYDIIILDEAQDITPLYFKLIYRIFMDCTDEHDKLKICLLGDKNQSIYSFNKADNRFITLGDRLFSIIPEDPEKLPRPWIRLQLSTSFRLTIAGADFINNCILGYERIKAIKPGDRVRYVICDVFGKLKGKVQHRPFKEVEYYLQKGYGYEDIFILAPSLKKDTSPVRMLSNFMSNVKKIPIYVPLSDDEKLDEEILRGKIVFSTFHQVKGLERKVVLVFGMDDSYFQFYGHGKDSFTCPNELYVATTRSLEMMTIFHHYQRDYLPFLRKDKLLRTCYFENVGFQIRNESKVDAIDTSVTDLCRHLAVELMEELCKYFDVYEVQSFSKKDDVIDVPYKTKQEGDLFEGISELNGIAIPAYFQYQLTGKMSIDEDDFPINTSGNEISVMDSFAIFKGLVKMSDDMIPSKRSTLNDKRDKIKKRMDGETVLKLANKWCSKKSGFQFKLNQIQSYNWLSDSVLNRCSERLAKYIPSNARFEVKATVENYPELANRRLVGYYDCLMAGILWEFKCVSRLEKSHYLQLALYAYMYYRSLRVNPGDTQMKFYLFNILSNEIQEIRSSPARLEEMVKILISQKYSKQTALSDNEFVEKMIASLE